MWEAGHHDTEPVCEATCVGRRSCHRDLLAEDDANRGFESIPSAGDRHTGSARNDRCEQVVVCKRGSTTSFPLSAVIPGWTEGLQLMNVGSAYTFVIPAHLAYGANGSPPVIAPNATLVFHVELISVG